MSKMTQIRNLVSLSKSHSSGLSRRRRLARRTFQLQKLEDRQLMAADAGFLDASTQLSGQNEVGQPAIVAPTQFTTSRITTKSVGSVAQKVVHLASM